MIVTLIRIDNGEPFVVSATKVPQSDGSMTYQLPTGEFAGQQPNAYGIRNDNAEPKQYQRATESGSTATFIPRDGDTPCVYLIGVGQVYPA